jgi:hypothetical protein
MNPTELQTILGTLLREQEQRFIHILDTLRISQNVQNGGTNATGAILPTGQPESSAPRLPDIEVFVADQESATHFEDWLKRFELSLQCAAPNISDKEKAMVLATKLSTDAFSEFRKSCLPKDITEYTYDESVTKLRLLFTRQRSIFADRYDCLRLSRLEGEEFMTLVNRCKAAIKRFDFEKLTSEQFSSLILLSALKAPQDEPLRAKILHKLSTDVEQV